MFDSAPSIPDTWALVKELHGAQVDKAGEPYKYHLHAVWEGSVVLAAELGRPDFHAIAHAALLHDVVEDTGATLRDLAEIGYPEEVLSIVDAVTKRRWEYNPEYIGRVIAAGPAAMIVKLADLRHNTRSDRMAGLPQATRARLKYKYFDAIDRIEPALGLPRSISDAEYAESRRRF